MPEETVNDIAHSAASYIRVLERLIRKNPGPSLIAAAVLGFLIGHTFNND